MLLFFVYLFIFQPVAAYVRLEPFFLEAQTDMNARRWGSAMSVYRKILAAVHPDDLMSMRGLAKCLLHNKSRKYSEAMGLLQRVVAIQAEVDDWMLLADACLGARKYDGALLALKSAAKMQGHDARQISVAAAKAFLGKGESNQALQHVSAVLTEDEGLGGSIFSFGSIIFVKVFFPLFWFMAKLCS